MTFFIKYVDGKIIDHPVSRINLLAVYPEYDFLETFHPDYVRFIREIPPDTGLFQKNLQHRYEFDGESVRDVYTVEEMTEEEKQNKIDAYIAANPKPFPSWQFDQATCSWQAPVKPPIQQVSLYFKTHDILKDYPRYTPHALPVWNEELQRWQAYIKDNHLNKIIEIICDAVGTSITELEE